MSPFHSLVADDLVLGSWWKPSISPATRNSPISALKRPDYRRNRCIGGTCIPVYENPVRFCSCSFTLLLPHVPNNTPNILGWEKHSKHVGHGSYVAGAAWKERLSNWNNSWLDLPGWRPNVSNPCLFSILPDKTSSIYLNYIIISFLKSSPYCPILYRVESLTRLSYRES
jgi:hypothetical protein